MGILDDVMQGAGLNKVDDFRLQEFQADAEASLGGVDLESGASPIPASLGGATSTLPQAEQPQAPLMPTSGHDPYALPEFDTLDSANDDFLEEVKRSENADKKGFTNGRFMMINSAEGKGKLNPTGLEIGYGQLVPEAWLGADEDKYPMVDGVRVNVRKGITERQASVLAMQTVQAKQTELFEAYPEIKGLTTPQQIYWTDFSYNGGVGAIAKNPSAKKALEDKQPIEAAIKTFSYWNTDGVATRGLFKRRINNYNNMARQMGLPKVTSYEWGAGRGIANFDKPFEEGDGAKAYVGKKAVGFNSKKMTSKQDAKSRTFEADADGVFE